VCGKKIAPGGMGGHMRLKHGIVVKTVVRDIRDIRGDIRDNVRADVSKKVRDMSETDGKIREQRPSDYVRKSSERVIEVKAEPAPIVNPEVDKWKDIHHPGVSVISDESYKEYLRQLKLQKKKDI
jgi:hypothetical protein